MILKVVSSQVCKSALGCGVDAVWKVMCSILDRVLFKTLKLTDSASFKDSRHYDKLYMPFRQDLKDETTPLMARNVTDVLANSDLWSYTRLNSIKLN